MNNFRAKTWIPAILALLLSLHQAMGAESANPLDDGQTLAALLCAQKPVLQADGILKISPAKGKPTRVPVRLRFVDGERSWQTIYETIPTNGVPLERVTVLHQEKAPSQYTHQLGESVTNSTLLVGDQASTPFAGSDLSLTDLGLEFFHWPAQQLVKKEVRKSRFCRVLESTNPNPGTNGYARVVSWIDAEYHNLLAADAYDANNKRVKQFSVSKVEKTKDGRWQLKELKIYNGRSDSTTTLEFVLNEEELGK
jgi:hypothetical protein